MSTYRRCKYCGDMHDVANWPDNHRDPEPARSDLSSPYTAGDIREYMSPVGTGPITSRSHRREDLKRAGCREVDPGERLPKTPTKREMRYHEQQSKA